MEKDIFTLDRLPLNSSAEISSVKCSEEIKMRMADLGIVPGTMIKALHRSPSGDPTAYSLLGSVISIRKLDASYIIVRNIKKGGGKNA